jgi:flagellar motor component MotA
MVRLYLDPGSGSFLIQLLIAGAAGAALFIATSWKRIKKMFNKNKDAKSEKKAEEEDEDE